MSTNSPSPQIEIAGEISRIHPCLDDQTLKKIFELQGPDFRNPNFHNLMSGILRRKSTIHSANADKTTGIYLFTHTQVCRILNSDALSHEIFQSLTISPDGRFIVDLNVEEWPREMNEPDYEDSIYENGGVDAGSLQYITKSPFTPFHPNIATVTSKPRLDSPILRNLAFGLEEETANSLIKNFHASLVRACQQQARHPHRQAIRGL